MTNERCEQVEGIFFDAMRQESAAGREQFLDEACKGDPSLRHEVDALLQAKSSPDSFLDRPLDLGETTGTDPNDMGVGEGEVIGRYKLLQQLGEGGFGVVYMAEQAAPVRRKVALKLIKPGMDSKEVIARFESERQALALMDHPNIAKVLDAGTTDSGRPYFVMDLVKGGSLTSYCDANNLPTRERLDLFMKVCRAVQHAHQKGIIHRDLKPANVMVTLHDGEPVPKVIDFGVSKALSQQLTEKTLFTRYGQIIGTPQYMSPEQAELSGLDVDTRSDIYSLGVLLYELLTGRPPFDSDSLQQAGLDEMRRMIREDEPPKPSTRLKTLNVETASAVASQRSSQPEALQKAVVGDLDWIVMKSLEKDRTRRYETAGNLVDDIERHLNDEPVNAGPPTLRYQLTKVFRRHRVAALTVIAISTAVLLALCATTVAWNRTIMALQEAETANEAKEQALAAEAKQKQIAIDNAKQAKLQADKAEIAADDAEQSLKLVRNLLDHAGPSIIRGKDATIRELLDDFAVRLDADPPQKGNVEVQVRMLLGSAYKSFSEFSKAKMQFDRAEEIGRQVFDTNSLSYAEFLLRLAQDQTRNADRYQQVSRVSSQLREARTICETLSPRGVLLIEVLTQLGDTRKACELTDALNSDIQKRMSFNPYLRLANRIISNDRPDEAEMYLEKARSFAQTRNAPNEIVECELVLSNLARMDSIERAIRHAELALKQSDNSISSETLRHVLEHRIDLEFDRKVLDQSALRRAALDVKRRMMASLPRLNIPQGPYVIGYVAGALMSAGEVDEAKNLLKLLEPLSGYKKNLAYHYLALWSRRDGELQKTNFYLSTRWDQLSSLDNPWPIICRARARFHGRDYSGGIQTLDRVVDWFKVNGVQNKPKVRNTYAFNQFERAIIYRLAGQNEKATSAFRDAASRFSRLSNDYMNEQRLPAWGDKNPSMRLLAMLFGEIHDGDRESLVEEIEGIESKKPLNLALRHAALGQHALDRGDTTTATDEFILAMKARPGRFEQINMEWVNETVVKLLDEQGNLDRLENLLRDDVARRDREVARNHPERAFVRIRLAEFLIRHDRPVAEAQQFLAEAKEIYDYHGKWIPDSEHQKLHALIAAAGKTQNSSDGQ